MFACVVFNTLVTRSLESNHNQSLWLAGYSVTVLTEKQKVYLNWSQDAPFESTNTCPKFVKGSTLMRRGNAEVSSKRSQCENLAH